MSIAFDSENDNDVLRAKINDILARITSLEDKVRELYYLIDEIQKRIEA